MPSVANEFTFQEDMIRQLVSNGWKKGNPDHYNRELALYPEDLLGFVKETQDAQWQKFCSLYPNNPEEKFLERVAAQLNNADPNAPNKEMRTFGTLGVLRHELRDRGTRFSLCQFKPEHDLNPDTLARYQKNRLRVVPELVYSPWATEEHLGDTGTKAKAWRIDLVLFVNGIPVATLELKSEFKQAVENAIKQYKTTRPPVDPITKKPEPLLTFKRGALVHFAVSQYEVYMTTKLAGDETFFLPFNKGTKEGGAGNDVPKDVNQYATDYLWNEVLIPDNLLNILARYVHLQIEEKETWEGRKFKKETLIFPRYHQWDVVNKLLGAAKTEGPGHKYLIQHSAGSGKSNSIAWTAHQLSSLHNDNGEKLFNSIIVVTDRTVLDDQLQDTIYQFEHVDGMIGRINRKEGDGSKSEKLAKALEESQPIIIVTIQTFPFVLKAIENSVSLKERRYAVIADEAHSSQSGTTARQLKEVLMVDRSAEDANDEVLSSDDILDATVASRRASPNLKGRDMRKAFDSEDYNVMIVANKFQTGFDQPKLRAMYVDKKLAGVECVQTLSRLNRIYPGKKETGTFVLDFFNDPDDILAAFQPYYKTAELTDVSDPNLIYDLLEKLRSSGIFLLSEVKQFCKTFYQTSKSNAAISNICKPAIERWQNRYKASLEAFTQAKDLFERTKKTKDAVLIANAENEFKSAKREKDSLEIFKKDLGTFVRFYEFMSQIVDYDDKDLEKLSLYARHLRPMLRESLTEVDDVQLDNVVLSHYRLSKIRQQDLMLKEELDDYGKLKPGEGLGTARPTDKKEEFLSQIIDRLNELFITDELSDKDLVNYAFTIRDKLSENQTIMDQIANNSAEQAMLGDFEKALDDAIIDSSEVHQNQKLQLLSNPDRSAKFARIIFDLLKRAS